VLFPGCRPRRLRLLRWLRRHHGRRQSVLNHGKRAGSVSGQRVERRGSSRGNRGSTTQGQRAAGSDRAASIPTSEQSADHPGRGPQGARRRRLSRGRYLLRRRGTYAVSRATAGSGGLAAAGLARGLGSAAAGAARGDASPCVGSRAAATAAARIGGGPGLSLGPDAGTAWGTSGARSGLEAVEAGRGGPRCWFG